MDHRSQHLRQAMESKTNFDLNQAISQWREEYMDHPGITSEDLRELESHLRESIAVRFLFILRKFRRSGVGKMATIQILESLPGRWQVDNNVPNIPAVKFWDKIISEYASGKYTSVEELHEKWGLLNIIRFSNIN